MHAHARPCAYTPPRARSSSGGTAHAVDNLGVRRLVDAALAAGGVKRFVLVSALLANAPACGQAGNGAYVALELLGGVLRWARVRRAPLCAIARVRT